MSIETLREKYEKELRERWLPNGTKGTYSVRIEPLHGREPRVDGYSSPSPEHIAWYQSLSRDPTTRGAVCNGCGIAQQQCEFTHEWVLAHVGHRP